MTLEISIENVINVGYKWRVRIVSEIEAKSHIAYPLTCNKFHSIRFSQSILKSHKLLQSHLNLSCILPFTAFIPVFPPSRYARRRMNRFNKSRLQIDSNSNLQHFVRANTHFRMWIWALYTIQCNAMQCNWMQ